MQFPGRRNMRDRCPRGKITEAQELCLQEHAHFLLDEMDCSSVVSSLIGQFILNYNDKERIMMGRDQTKRDQNARLIETICHRTPAGFDAFLRALKETGHTNAYETLTMTLRRSTEDEAQECAQNTTVGSSSAASHPSNPARQSFEEDSRGQIEKNCNRVDNVENEIKRMEKKTNTGTEERQAEVDRLKAKLAKAKREIKRLKTNSEKRTKALEEQKKIHQQELEKQNKIHQQELERLKKIYKQEIEKQKKPHQQEIEKQKKLHQQEVETQEKIHQLEIEKQKKIHQQEIEKQKKIHQNQLEEQQKELEQLTKAEEKIAKLEKELQIYKEDNLKQAEKLESAEVRLGRQESKVNALEEKQEKTDATLDEVLKELKKKKN